MGNFWLYLESGGRTFALSLVVYQGYRREKCKRDVLIMRSVHFWVTED